MKMSKLTARHLSDCLPDFSTVYILSKNTNSNSSNLIINNFDIQVTKLIMTIILLLLLFLKKESQFVSNLVQINPQKYGTKYIRLQML